MWRSLLPSGWTVSSRVQRLCMQSRCAGAAFGYSEQHLSAVSFYSGFSIFLHWVQYLGAVSFYSGRSIFLLRVQHLFTLGAASVYVEQVAQRMSSRGDIVWTTWDSLG